MVMKLSFAHIVKSIILITVTI